MTTPRVQVGQGNQPPAPVSWSDLAVKKTFSWGPRWLSWAFFGIGLLLMIGVGTYALHTLSQVKQASQWRANSSNLISKLEAAQKTLAQAESSQRGYVLTGQSRFLQEFDETRRTVVPALDELRELLSGNERQTNLLNELSAAVADRLRLLDLVMSHARSNAREKALQEIRSGAGPGLMVKIKSTFEDMIGSEKLLLKRREKAFDTRMTYTTNLIAALAGVAFLIFLVAVLAFRADLVKRKVIEQELSIAQEKAMELLGLKASFLANMSHEIRTPLNGIIGMAELLPSTGLSSVQQSYVNVIQQSADALMALINSVLDLSKIDAGKLELERSQIDLKQIIQSSMKILEYPAKHKNVAFTLELPTSVPTNYLADPVRLSQILLNLLNNAIKFTDEGYVKLSVSVVSKADSNGRLVLKFTVRDTGCGIPPHVVGDLFKPFSQADVSTTRKYGGTGLGLTICRELVALMDGEIGVESVEGIGSTFWFTCSLEQIEAPPQLAEGESCKVPARRSTILVVEDNFFNQQVIGAMLSTLKHSFTLVSNGQEALSALERERFDVVLMDCQMPVMDGYEATAKIRQHANPAIRKLPVIAITANAIKGEYEKCLAAGMTGYISKPIVMRDLVKSLAETMSWNEATATEIDSSVIDSLAEIEGPHTPNLRRDLIENFIQQIPLLVPQLRTLIAEGKHDEISAMAHSLKSTFGNIGAPSLRLICATLEIEAQASPPLTMERAGEMVSELESRLGRAIPELEDYMNANLTKPKAG